MRRESGGTRWRRRVVVRSAIMLLLGLIVTSLVAWVHPVADPANLSPFGWGCEGQIHTGVIWAQASKHEHPAVSTWWFDLVVLPEERDLPDGPVHAGSAPPRWTRARRQWHHVQPVLEDILAECQPEKAESDPWDTRGAAGPRGERPRNEWVEVACGWPFRCYRAWGAQPDLKPHGANAIPLSFITPPHPDTFVLDPPPDYIFIYSPWWPGLLANTLLYAAALQVLWFACGRVARYGRSRWQLMVGDSRLEVGRCPRCDYDLCGDMDKGCPECGWGREDDEVNPQ